MMKQFKQSECYAVTIDFVHFNDNFYFTYEQLNRDGNIVIFYIIKCRFINFIIL